MYKVYGFKEKDIKDLALFIKKNRFLTLDKLFRAYAAKSGKAAGSVRNLYYALVKTAQNDGEFCREYLGGKPISVCKTKKFEKEEEIKLLTAVFNGIKNGDSVRKTINAAANDNGKTALRLLNKYRSLLKNKQDLVKEVSEKVGISLPTATAEKVSSDAESKVKKEIDALIGRISAKIKAENVRLRERILFLDGENRRLRERAFADKNGKVIKYFGRGGTHFPPDGYGLN